jgi:hypothetical protein
MTGQLVLVEARRLLRNPYLWAVAVASPALLFPLVRHQLPNLAEDTINAGMFSFLIAAAGLMIANLATLRDQREGVPETLAALPGRPDARTLAVLVATGVVAAILVVAAIGGYLLIRLAQGSTAGRVEAGEIFAAAAGAAVLAAAGVALGRWAPTAIVAPAALGMLAVLFFLGELLRLSWYLPITAPYTTQVFGRPVWPRLAYLAAVLLLLAALALLRHRRGPRRLGITAAALAAVVTAGIAVAVTAPPSRGDGTVDQGAPVTGQPDRECTERNGITYCYFPGFGAWVPYWARVAEPIAAALPAQQRHRMPTIAQHTSFGPQLEASGEAAMVRMVWGRGDAGLGDRTELAGQIADLVTGVPVLSLPEYFPGDGAAADDGPPWCGGSGQARVAIAFWLLAQSVPQRLQTAGPDGELARALLDRAGARELIWEHWDVLLDEDTTIDEAVSLLGLPAGGGSCD